MAKLKWNDIVKQARLLKKNVESDYKMGMNSKWAYYFAKAIITVNTDVKKITFDEAKNPSGSHISRQIPKKDCFNMCRRLIKYVETNKKMPNYVAWNDYAIIPRLLAYALARMLIYYADNGAFPKYVNFNDKCYTKPTESENEVYKYFVETFGDFGDTIDGALEKVEGRGYAYYYDDVYSNRNSINRLRDYDGINCTDSCHVFYNIMLELIKKGKYKKVECLHVMCSSGGHVKLRITLNDGDRIIRDPACAISDNGNGYTCNWCTNDPIAVDPSWFMENLYR